MPTVFPEQPALVMSKAAIAKALGLEGGVAVAVRDVAGAYRSISDGDTFVLCFTGAVPASIEVEVTPAGGAATTKHVLTLGDGGVARAAAERNRPIDPARPFLLAVAGIIASAVAILVATFTGVASKDAAAPYQMILAEVMVWMAAVIVLATIAALLLQALRVGWMWSQGNSGARGWTFARGVALVLCLIVCAVPVYYGWFAAKAAVRGGIGALKWEDDKVPWALQMFR